MDKTEAIIELYKQVQECKLLLIEWQRTSKLNKEQKRFLRRRTKIALARSSTTIVSQTLYQLADLKGPEWE